MTRAGRLLLLTLALALPIACGGPDTTAPEPPPSAPPGTTVDTPADAELPEGTRFRTAAQCGACHEAIYAEWKESMHGQAMSDFLFLDMEVDNREECIRCHAPVPIRDVDFDVPIARLDRREDAVSCLSCHQSGDHMAGPFKGLSGACNPIHDDAQRNVVKMCFGCHNQHDTGTEWLNSPYGPHASEPRTKQETTCLDCHMPWVERPLVKGGPVRKGRRHTWFGGHHLPQLKKAGKLDVEVEDLEGGGFRFRVWVTNVGAGHMMPTDARHRSFDTYVKLWDADGNVILDPLDPMQQSAAHAATYRQFYRGSGVRDTQIPPLARVSTIEASKGYVDVATAMSGRGEAWLVSRLTPSDALDAKSVSEPEVFEYYRARLVTKVSFEYGP